MKSYFQFLLTILVAYYFSGCGDVFCSKLLTFEIPITLTPSKSEYKLGDTITVASKFSKDMIDVITHEKIRVSNYDFSIDMYLGQDDTKPTKSANTLFITKIDIGKMSLQRFHISDTTLVGGIGAVHQISYQENLNDYTMLCKIVPTKKGLFRIHFSSSVSDSDAGLLKNCRSTVDFLRFNMNNRTNNHYEFSQTSPDENIKKITKEEFDRSGSYAFYVK